MTTLLYNNKIMFNFLFMTENGNKTLIQLITKMISKYRV